MSLLNVDEIQADAILDMKLAKLTRIDKNELIQEKEEKEIFIEECNRIINEKEYRDATMIKNIASLRDLYGDARRTKLDNVSVEKEEKEIEFVEPEKCVVVLTESGLVKRIPAASFKTQRRNGKGVKTQDDITSMVIRTNTIDSLMIFTNKGKMYRLLVNDIPEGTNVSKGQSIKSLITMDINEQPTVIYSIYRDTDAKFVLFTTKNGVVKKTPLDEYIKTQKRTGIAAINIREDDELISVNLIKDENILFVTSGGYSMRIKAEDISISSRIAIGYKGITLHSDDSVVAALPIRNNEDSLAIFSTNGMGKKFPVSECPVQNRGGKGLICYKPTNSSGPIAAATLISDEDNILICGDKTSLCISATEIPSLGRVSIGNQLIKGSSIVSVSKV
jgi:DNA gyrase subunit A